MKKFNLNIVGLAALFACLSVGTGTARSFRQARLAEQRAAREADAPVVVEGKGGKEIAVDAPPELRGLAFDANDNADEGVHKIGELTEYIKTNRRRKASMTRNQLVDTVGFAAGQADLALLGQLSKPGKAYQRRRNLTGRVRMSNTRVKNALFELCVAIGARYKADKASFELERTKIKDLYASMNAVLTDDDTDKKKELNGLRKLVAKA